MKWLSNNYGTMAMAFFLSLVTVVVLTKRPDAETQVTIYAQFTPVVRADVTSLRYVADNQEVTDRILVTISGDRPQIEVIQLTCRPILDEGKFPSDPSKRQIILQLTSHDFGITAEMAKRITVQNVTLRIQYSRFEVKSLPIRVLLTDLVDRPKAGFKVEGVRAVPPEIKVRLPADNAIKALPIRPIRISGRSASFVAPGDLDNENPDLREVKAQESFTVEVDVVPVQFQLELPDVPVFLSSPPLTGHAVDLLEPKSVRVILEGPEEIVKSVHPEQLHVFVKLDWPPGARTGDYSLPIRCDVADDALRRVVRVRLHTGERSTALVRVAKT
ncbi:MAG TPA: hypothetical protein VK661_01525 [Planctomycetota bacterium]|nr:hypothetical protein [Planctomycetota bacterium]